jgi:hypothetical protein
MTASLQSILQGLSSMLAVAVVALLPAACEKPDERAGRAGIQNAEALEAAPVLSDRAATAAAIEQDVAQRETRLCNSSEGRVSCQPGQPDDRLTSRPRDPAESLGKRALQATRSRRDPRPAAHPGS